MNQVLGIDVGGTAVKLGRFDSAGNCLHTITIDTPQPSHPEPVLAAIVAAIPQVDPDGVTRAIGIGTPGPADVTGRVAIMAINLEAWDQVPVADYLEAHTGRSTVLANDANCAGWGEAWLGAGRPYQNFILLTLGTGVGGAIIINGQLYTGSYGAAGELGLISFDPDGPVCRSGNAGSLEQQLSIGGVQRRANLDPAELGRRAQAGDPTALAFWQGYGRDLGIGLTSLMYVLTPEAVIIGGGLSASGEFFLPAAWAEVERRVQPSSRVGLRLVGAELGNRAGMTGAARLALAGLADWA